MKLHVLILVVMLPSFFIAADKERIAGSTYNPPLLGKIEADRKACNETNNIYRQQKRQNDEAETISIFSNLYLSTEDTLKEYSEAIPLSWQDEKLSEKLSEQFKTVNNIIHEADVLIRKIVINLSDFLSLPFIPPILLYFVVVIFLRVTIKRRVENHPIKKVFIPIVAIYIAYITISYTEDEYDIFSQIATLVINNICYTIYPTEILEFSIKIDRYKMSTFLYILIAYLINNRLLWITTVAVFEFFIVFHYFRYISVASELIDEKFYRLLQGVVPVVLTAPYVLVIWIFKDNDKYTDLKNKENEIEIKEREVRIKEREVKIKEREVKIKEREIEIKEREEKRREREDKEKESEAKAVKREKERREREDKEKESVAKAVKRDEERREREDKEKESVAKAVKRDEERRAKSKIEPFFVRWERHLNEKKFENRNR